MIAAAGIVILAGFVPAQAAACARAPLQVVDDASALITVQIDPACLNDPTDTGIIMADLAQQLIAAHLAANPDQSHAAVWEVISESFVSEILVPTDPTPLSSN